jgi:hypothetical protein
MKLTGHVELMKEKRKTNRLLTVKKETTRKSQDVGGWIILKWIMKR